VPCATLGRQQGAADAPASRWGASNRRWPRRLSRPSSHHLSCTDVGRVPSRCAVERVYRRLLSCLSRVSCRVYRTDYMELTLRHAMRQSRTPMTHARRYRASQSTCIQLLVDISAPSRHIRAVLYLAHLELNAATLLYTTCMTIIPDVYCLVVVAHVVKVLPDCTSIRAEAH